MNIEILISTMHQKNHSILNQLNLQTNAIVVNQCSENSVEELDYHGLRIIWVNTTQRGLSKSRNLALSYATADICLIADEDETLVDKYPEIILGAFDSDSDADIISFNFDRLYSGKENQNRKSPTRKPNKSRKAPYFRYYSSVSLAFRLIKIVKHGIHFNELIGAGTNYGAGEEALFLISCRKAKLNVYENSSTICSVDFTSSSWFTGYDEKFYFDTGIFLGCAYGKFAKLMSLYFLNQSRSLSQLPMKVVYKQMEDGIKAYRKL